jgi:LmbE family N-acetylglucosaminyl deacetylase
LATVVFVHAHPDDEAIFTGGTLLRLAATGHRTVVVLCTNGDHDPASAQAATRVEEARVACDALGVQRLELLGYGDSGLFGEHETEAAFCRADPDAAAARLAQILREERADAVVLYDPHGIYGHPDHVAVHRIGSLAAGAVDVPTVYECTVDREYLHFVETHLVGHAVESLLGAEVTATNLAPLGVPTVMVTTTIDVRAECDGKRRAMALHASQIDEASETLTMDRATFEGVYGYEWYMRSSGPRGPLDLFDVGW